MKGLIPFSWEEVKVGDRIIHKFSVLNNNYTAYLGRVTRIEYDDTIPFLLTNRQAIPLNPKVGGWNCYIDRRPRYKRLFHNIFG